MTSIQRIEKILVGLLMLACCALMVYEPDVGFYVVALILALMMLIYALRCFIFYFSMARHMVGGKSLLFRGIIVLDLAVFTISMVDDPKMYIILYLLGIHAFAGVTGVLRALEARRYGAPSWRWSMALGIGNSRSRCWPWWRVSSSPTPKIWCISTPDACSIPPAYRSPPPSERRRSSIFSRSFFSESAD